MRKELIFGKSDNISATYSLVRGIGGNYLNKTIGENLTVTSDNINDNISGSGANMIEINGLDEDYNLQSEIIKLNGLTQVTTNKKYIKTNNMRVVKAGISEKNEGNIIIKDQSLNSLLSIEQNFSKSLSSLYTVEKNCKAKFTKVFYNVPKSKDVMAKLIARVNNIQYTIGVIDLFESQGFIELDKINTYPGKTDFFVLAKSSSSNTELSIFYVLEIEGV